jgi:hypothetical protein
MVALEAGGRGLDDADLDGKLAVLVGEDGALPKALVNVADERVAAGSGPAGIRPSMAAEAAVVLFEAARRRGAARTRRGDA